MKLKIDVAKMERFRVSEGLLKRELAAKAKIHPNQITRIIAGEAVGVRVARCLSGAMGVRVSEITSEIVESASDRSEPTAATATG